VELWVEDDFFFFSVEMKGMDPRHTWEITGIFRAPKENVLAIERLAARILPTCSLNK
jgi:hypothetical protein